MSGAVGQAVTGAALLVAAWSLVGALRERPVGRLQLAAMGVVEALIVALIAVAVGRLAHGQRPHELVTFIGYLVAVALIMPAAGVLARLEPTRWGSVITMVGCLIVPVLVLRLDQVWTGVG